VYKDLDEVSLNDDRCTYIGVSVPSVRIAGCEAMNDVHARYLGRPSELQGTTWDEQYVIIAVKPWTF
jgi:hypothetical protein